MRLAVVTPEYAGVTAYTGGIGSQYAMLAPELARQGHDVAVVTLAPDDPGARELHGVRLSLVAQPGRAILRPPAWTRAAGRALRELGQLDLVLACEYAGGAWAYSRDEHRAPLVTHLHSSTIQIAVTSGWLRRQRVLPVVVMSRGLERSQTRRSDALVAPTRSILDWSRRLWDLPSGMPAEIVPNAVEVEFVRRLAEGDPPDGFPDSGPVIAYAGRLEPRKGVHVLVDAMRQVWAEVPDAQLVLLGADNPYRGESMAAHLRKAAGEHSARLHLLGPQPRERLFPALRAADVVALPSLWENFATAALEGMALGCPMVVSSGTGFDEFMRPEQDALMPPRGDPAELASALLRLLRDEELRGRLGAAAATSAEAFDVAPVARQMAETLSRLGAARRE